jgi:hypothetical protein
MSVLYALENHGREQFFPLQRDLPLSGPVEKPVGPPLNDLRQKIRSKTFGFLRLAHLLANLG